MKKALALVLALVLCLGVFAGCQQDTPDTTKAPETTAAPAETTAPPAETTEPAPTEYTFPAGVTVSMYAGEDVNDLPLDKFIEDATGVNVKWIPLGGEQEYVSMMTQKVTPALVYHYSLGWAKEMGGYGALVNLMDYQELLPNFFRVFDSYGEDLKKAYMSSEDELYCSPCFTNGNTEVYSWIYREDIFAKHNLTFPTTWDELLNVCKVLKEAYPDTYPVCFRNMGPNLIQMNEFAQQFGVDYLPLTPTLDKATGTYFTSWTTDEARVMLKMLHELIENKYMDPAVFTYSLADWIAEFATGRCFIGHDKPGMIDRIVEAGKEMDPNFALGWTLNMPFVESDVPYEGHEFTPYDYIWAVTSKCEDLEVALRFFDWLFTDEGIEIMNWGVEGESYYVDENGDKFFMEDFEPANMANFQNTPYVDFEATIAAYSPNAREAILSVLDAIVDCGNARILGVSMTDEEKAIKTTYQAGYYACRDSYWQNFLVGNLDIDNDEHWQKFKDEIAANGEAELLRIYADAYARYVSAE